MVIVPSPLWVHVWTALTYGWVVPVQTSVLSGHGYVVPVGVGVAQGRDEALAGELCTVPNVTEPKPDAPKSARGTRNSY